MRFNKFDRREPRDTKSAGFDKVKAKHEKYMLAKKRYERMGFDEWAASLKAHHEVNNKL